MKKAIVFLLLACMAFAHQPRIVEGAGIVEIHDPETSQAFYGDLNGSPAVFEIKSEVPFRLYVGITVPEIPGAMADKSVEVTRAEGGLETKVFFLNASAGWKPFYEEFAGDSYLQGPEGRANASAGTYIIRVSSPGNSGRYALAVGEEESFGPADTINAVVLLPKLKSWFFGKPPWDALFTKVYLFAFLPVFAAAAVLALIVWVAGSVAKAKAPAALKRKVALIGLAAPIIIALALFVPAGTLGYWQGWMYMGTVLAPAALVITYFMKKDPEFLERRLRTREREARQGLMLKLAMPVFIIAFLLPGLDRRFGWSAVPAEIAIAADALVFMGYMFIFLVFRENSYAGRTVQVDKGQTVISTGPYAIVRHPMYLGAIIMYLATPLALGSYVAVPAFALFLSVLIFRIMNEEEVLRRDLPGYKEYCRKTKYRLIPFIW